MSDISKGFQINQFEQFEKEETEAEQRILKVYAAILVSMKIYLSELYKKHESDGKLTYEEMLIGNKIDSFDEALKKLVVKLYSNTSKTIDSTLDSIYRSSFTGTGEALEKSGVRSLTAIIKEDELYRAAANDISGLKWTDRMKIHREYAVCKIRETLVRGLHEGETYGQMAKRLDRAMEKDVVNPIRIVRTEGHRVFSQAKKDRLDRLPNQNFIKEWVTSRDERVRQTEKANHAFMDGKKVLYDDNFILPNGNSGFAPAMIGAAEDDINCRCIWVISVLKDEEVFYRDYTFEAELPDVFQEAVRQLPDSDKEQLERYTGFAGTEINKALRKNAPSKVQEKVERLDRVLAANVLPENIVLKRGTIMNSFEGYEQIKDIRQIDTASLVGTILHDKAFISTSILTPQTGMRNVEMRINAPKGYNGLYIAPVATPKYQYQQEVLLKRDSYFKVKSAELKNERLHLEVDLVYDSKD